MPEIPVRFPFNGLVRATGLAKQPQGSTDSATNVRATDPISGRVRGAVRSGTTAFNSNDGGGRIDRLSQLTYQNKLGTYAVNNTTQANATRMLVELTEAYVNLTAMTTDDQGSVFLVHGNVLLKFNDDGYRLWSITITPIERGQEVCEIEVDNLGVVYCATSRGGDSTKGRIYAYTEDEEGNPRQLWVQDVDSHIAAMRFSSGKLFCGCNDEQRWRSRVIVYDDVLSAAPIEATRFPVPYPVSGMALRDDTTLYVSSPSYQLRGRWPSTSGTPGTGLLQPTVSWTPRDLTDWQQRLWSWHSADNIDGLSNTSLEDGDEVKLWVDQSFHGRDLIVPYDQNKYKKNAYRFRGPTYVKESFYGGPSILFDGDQTTGGDGTEGKAGQSEYDRIPALVSPQEGNSSSAASQRFAQKTVLPAYKGAKWSAFFVIRTSQASRVEDANYGDATTIIPGEPAILNNQTVFAQEFDRGGGTEYSKHTMRALQAHCNLGGGDNIANWTEYKAIENGGRVRWREHEGTLAVGTDTFVAQTPTVTSGLTDTTVWEVKWDSATNANGYVRYNDLVGSITSFAAGSANRVSKGAKGRSWLGYYPYHAGDWMVSSEGFPGYLGADDWHNPFGGEILEMVVIDETDSDDALTSDERKRLRAYLFWKYGHQNNLTDSTGYNPSDDLGPPAGPDVSQTALDVMHNWTGGLLSKFTVDGKPVWCIPGKTTHTVIGGMLRYSAIGESVSCKDGSNLIVSLGYSYSSDPVNYDALVRGIVDDGETYDFNDAAAWTWPTQDSPVTWTSFYDSAGYGIRMQVDEFGNTFVPWVGDPALNITCRVFGDDGTLRFSLREVQPLLNCPGVALGPKVDYQDDVDTVDVRQKVWLHAPYQLSGLEMFGSFELVSFTPTSPGSPRLQKLIAIVDGAFYTVTEGAGAWAAINDSEASPQAFATSGHYVGAAEMNGELFFVNGEEEFVYNPIRQPDWEPGDTSSEACVKWVSHSAGKVPRTCKLIGRSMGRMFLARPAEDPQQWYCSAEVDPYDWNFLPRVPKLSQAVAGVSSDAGAAPDIVNALIPWTSDRMIFGCDHSLWVLAGNPMAGGIFESISSVYGTAFGSAYAMDPDGVLYVAGSRGGVLRITPGGGVQNMTKNTVARSIEDVDLGTYRVELAWNEEDDGLHVFLVPWSTHAAVVTHWFWERRSDSWWEDEWSSDAIAQQPTCALTIDGDAYDDRKLLIGSQDGFIRYWDRDATSDDGIEIPSKVLIGPMVPDEAGGEWLFTRLRIAMADTQGGCTYRIYTTDRADSLGEPVAQGQLQAGRNPILPIRKRGAYVYLELLSAQAGQRWAFESASIEADPFGVRRST